MSQSHRNLNGLQLHAPGYAQSGDPGSVGVGQYWFDINNGRYVLKVRNQANGGWDIVKGALFTNIDPGTEAGAGALWVDTTFGSGGYILRVRNSTNAGWETLSGGQVPIGSPIFWDKTLMASVGVVTLPWGYVYCNGQVLNDTQSILHGKTIPNLNIGDGTGKYVRGTTGATEVVQSSQNLAHTHGDGSLSTVDHTHGAGSLSAADHTHTTQFGQDSHGSGGTDNLRAYGTDVTKTSAGSGALAVSGSTAGSGAVDVTGTTGSSGGTEVRPETMTMAWIMRVK